MKSLMKFIILGSCCLYPISLNAKACSEKNKELAVNKNFTTQKNGTIKHHPSGLEFKQCLEGQSVSNDGCKGTARSYSWLEAESHAKTQIFNSKQDWRLPKIEELQILLTFVCNKATVDKTLFPSLSTEQIWSASPGAPVNDHSVVLNVSDGAIYGVGRGVKRQVLLVRGKPSRKWLEQEPPSDWVIR